MEPTAIPLHLRESFKTGVYVAGLSEKVVSDANEAYQVMLNSLVSKQAGIIFIIEQRHEISNNFTF